MNEQHCRMIDQLISRYINDGKYPAMIVMGQSPEERESSVLNILLVASDKHYSLVKAEGEHFRFDVGLPSVPGVFVNVRIVSRQYLEDTADGGDETNRASFMGAWCAYTHLQGLEDLIRRIPSHT